MKSNKIKKKQEILLNITTEGTPLNRYVTYIVSRKYDFFHGRKNNVIPIKEKRGYQIEWKNLVADFKSLIQNPISVLPRIAYSLAAFWFIFQGKHEEAYTTAFVIGALAHDETQQSSHSGEPSTVTLTATVDNVANRIAIMYGSGLNSGITVTFDGNATASILATGNLVNFYYLAPGTGSKNAIFSGGTIKVCVLSIYNGVDQADPIGATVTEDGSASPNDMALTTEANNSLRLDSVGLQKDNASDCTGSLDQGTQRANPQTPQNQFRERLFVYENSQAVAGADTYQWTVDAFQRWYGAFELKAASVGLTSPSAIGNPFHPGMGVLNMARFHPAQQQSTRLGIAYTQALSDTLALTDSVSKSLVRTLTETIVFVSTTLKSIVRTLADTIVLSEVFSAIKTQFKTLTDTLGLTDSLTKTPGKGLSDTLPLSSTVNRSMTRILTDTLGLTDTIATAVTYVKSLSDSIGLTDTLSRLTGKGLSDSISFSETIGFVRGYFKTFSDSIGLTDTISATKLYVRTLTDQIFLTENFTMLFNSITGGIHRLLTQTFRSFTNPKPEGGVTTGDKPDARGNSSGDKPTGV